MIDLIDAGGMVKKAPWQGKYPEWILCKEVGFDDKAHAAASGKCPLSKEAPKIKSKGGLFK